MIRIKWQILTFLGLLIAFVMAGCVSKTNPSISCKLDQPPSKASSSSPLAINIYIDGTPSMQGYVTHPTNTKTQYVKTIDLLERVLFLGGTPSKIQKKGYYRLGETPKAIGRQGYLEATQIKFYAGGTSNYPRLQTVKLENAISSSQDENKLTVIITDLYQNQEDTNKINEAIENYLNTNLNTKNNKTDYAVGIVAIKSEFNGDVYIEDGSNNRFRYQTNNTQGQKNKEFRPFYLIFIGQYTDISAYFRKLSDKIAAELQTDSHLAIFSANNFVQELSYVDTRPKLSNNTIKQIESVRSSPRIEIKKEEKIHLFSIKKSSDSEIEINYNFPLKTYINTILPFSNGIETETSIQVFDDLKKEFKSEPKDSPLSKALEVGKWQKNSQNSLDSVVTIKPSILPKPGFYYFIVDAKVKAIEPEKWWKDWSSDNNKVEDWKTLNLKKFLVGLKDSTDKLIQEKQPVIGRFCYGIVKE